MEYLAIVVLFILGFVAVAVDITSSIFWVILVGTVLSWILSLIFQLTKKLKPFKVCYNIFFVGRILTIVMFIALLLIRWLLPWLVM